MWWELLIFYYFSEVECGSLGENKNEGEGFRGLRTEERI